MSEGPIRPSGTINVTFQATLSIDLSIRLSIYPSIYPLTHSPIDPPIYPLIYPSIYPFTHPWLEQLYTGLRSPQLSQVHLTNLRWGWTPHSSSSNFKCEYSPVLKHSWIQGWDPEEGSFFQMSLGVMLTSPLSYTIGCIICKHLWISVEVWGSGFLQVSE